MNRIFFFASLVALATSGCPSSTTQTTDGGGIADAGTDAFSSNDDAGLDAFVSPDTGLDAGGLDAFVPPNDTNVDAGVRVPVNHRADDSQCQATAPAGNCSFGGGAGICDTDADCTMGVDGRCNMSNGGAVFCRCTYDTCQHDTDCATGETCACHGAAFHSDSNECIAGNCRVDADCGTNGFCSPTIGGCGGLAGYYCHTASDLCIDDADCTGGSIQACQYVSASSRWECVERLFCP